MRHKYHGFCLSSRDMVKCLYMHFTNLTLSNKRLPKYTI